ncbi:hypothetical protein [Geopseudomonas aromaticivorans]
MERFPLMARAGLLALAIATAAGCASSPSQPTSQAKERPMVQLQDPDQTPREKWSHAMVILREGMGIQGQKDIPKELIDSEAAKAIQKAATYNRAAVLPAGGTVTGIAGYASPPTGLSSGGALGAGLALGFLTSYQPQGPAMHEQLVAWVPESEAANMDEAIQVALDTFYAAHDKALADPEKRKVIPSKYPKGYDPTEKYASLMDLFMERPIVG